MKELLQTNLFVDDLASGLNLSIIEKVLGLLKPHWKNAERYCFYPSSSTDIKRVFDLNADVYFFADCSTYPSPTSRIVHQILENLGNITVVTNNPWFLIFEKDGKRGYFFDIRNREVLEIIHQMAGFLNFFVGVNDGCGEGGNNECTNEPPFLELVSQLTPSSGMILLLDHSHFFDQFTQYNFDRHYISLQREILDKYTNYPYGPTRLYEISVHEPMIHEWNWGNLKLTVEHDNIFIHQEELDLLIAGNEVKTRAKFRQIKLLKKFDISPYLLRPNEFREWSAEQALSRALFYLMHRDCKVLGITASGQGEHSTFLEILKNHDFLKPVHVRFFCLDKEDFSSLIEKISNEYEKKI